MQPGPSTQPGYTDQDGGNGGSTEATANVNKPAAGHDSVREGDAVNQTHREEMHSLMKLAMSSLMHLPPRRPVELAR